jgi:hypothetical protein
MDLLSFGLGALYYLFVLGLFSFLLMRGVTELFVACFAGGALIHLLQTLGFLYLRSTGGFSTHARFLPLLGMVGLLGTLFFAAGFISLGVFLLRGRGKA